MKQLLVALGMVLLLVPGLLVPGASAQDEPLPERVAQAYLAYETAMAAGDEDAASRAARTAWQAARDARIDPELVGILAENYGLLALRRGEYGRAHEPWRNAAEISDSLNAPAIERALRWYQASKSAFLDGDARTAQRCSLRSVEAASESETPLDATLSGDIHYMMAATSGSVGRQDGVVEHARLALEAFAATDRPYDLIYANAYKLSGIGRYFGSGRVAAMFDFHMARSILVEIGAEPALLAEVGYWLEATRQSVSEEELAALASRIAASAFPESESLQTGGVAAAAAFEVDAVPIRRRNPNYPSNAAANGVGGALVLRFNVTETGGVEAVTVVAALPSGVFEYGAVRTLRLWRFEPAQIDGQPVRREGMLAKFEYSLCPPLPDGAACWRAYAAHDAAW